MHMVFLGRAQKKYMGNKSGDLCGQAIGQPLRVHRAPKSSIQVIKHNKCATDRSPNMLIITKSYISLDMRRNNAQKSQQHCLDKD